MSEHSAEIDAERVYQADPHSCVAVAREAVKKVWAELDSESPDLQAIRTQMGVVRAWLPSWLEREWDDRMCEWMHRESAQHRCVTSPADDRCDSCSATTQHHEVVCSHCMYRWPS